MTASINLTKSTQEGDQAVSTPGFVSESKELAITANRVSMTFSNGAELYPVLKEISLEIPCGEIQLLMGPSGSGKTTLLSILAGILTPTSGTVHLLGQEITRMTRGQLSQFRLDHIGFIFQGFNLFPALTAIENVEVALKMKGLRGTASHQKAQELLAQVGLADRATYLPRDLSGGQKQRVAIARALAGDPDLLMADEPTASLDSHSGHAVIELLRELAKESNRTVLIVTHDARLIDVADRVTYLEDGVLKPNQ